MSASCSTDSMSTFEPPDGMVPMALQIALVDGVALDCVDIKDPPYELGFGDGAA